LADLVRASATRREFVSRAYRQAVWSLDDLSPDLGESQEALVAVRGIGSGVARLITDFRNSGQLEGLIRLSERLPKESNRLRVLPRMTPNRLHWLKAELGVETVVDLTGAIRQGRLADLKGVGPDTARTWLERLEGMPPEGMSAVAARGWAQRLVAHIERHVKAVLLVTGSVRRLDEWVHEIDLVAAVGEGVIPFVEQSALVTGFARVPGAVRLETLGIPVTLHSPPTSSAAAVVFRTTGPPDHVGAVTERIAIDSGIEAAATETDIYHQAGLVLVPAPARSAALDVPPDLVRVEQLRGDLHLHSDWSPDGRQSIEELVRAARSRGLEYLGLTDHAKGLRFGGLDEDRIGQQREAIEAIRPLYPDLVILQGSELNIDRDGDLDFADSVLDRLDFAIAAVHSFFTLDRSEQTRRLLNAIANPKVNVIAHLTGRRVGVRPPIDIDLDSVLGAAADSKTALEVNGHLDRMDISAELVGRARGLGAFFAANSDAHRPHELANAAYSVGILQRGWVSRPEVVNCWPVDELLAWMGSGRAPRTSTEEPPERNATGGLNDLG
jgi:DNA polymerase (family 10)